MSAIGIENGTKFMIIGHNKPEWINAELGCMAAGGIPTGAYPDSLSEEIEYLIVYSEATIIVVRDQEQADKIQRVVESKEPLREEFAQPSEELAVPIICDIEFDHKKKELSVNVPNENLAVSNLPEDAIVETRFFEYHGESRDDLYMTKEKLLAVGDRLEKQIAADRATDSAFR